MSGMEWPESYLSWSSKSLQSTRILREEDPVHFIDIEGIPMTYLYYELELINSFSRLSDASGKCRGCVLAHRFSPITNIKAAACYKI